MGSENNDQKPISANTSEGSSLTDTDHVPEFYFDMPPSSEERESGYGEFANVPVTSTSQAQNSLMSQLLSCGKPNGTGLQSTKMELEGICTNVSYTNGSNRHCSEWSNNVFQQICQHVHREPSTEFYFRLLLIHLLKLVMHSSRKNDEFKRQHLGTQTNYHDDVFNKHRIWQELVRCIHATLCPLTPGGNADRIADLCACVNSSTPDLSERTSQRPVLLQWRHQSNSFTDVSLHKDQRILSDISQRLSLTDCFSRKESVNLHCKCYCEAGTQTENPFLLSPLPTIVLDPSPFPPSPSVAAKGSIPLPPPIIQVNTTLSRFHPTELAKHQSSNISCSRSTLPIGSCTSVNHTSHPTAPAINKLESSGNLHSLANGRLKPFRWTKVPVNDSSVWSCHIEGESNPMGETELKVDFKQLERLFGRHVRNGSDEVHSKNKRVTDGPTDIHCDTNGHNDRFTGNRSSSSDLLIVNPEERNYNNACSLLPSVNLRERSASLGRRNPSQQRHFESTLLDNKRCLNVNIFLRQFRSSSVNVLELIERRDSAPLGCERLKCLVKLLPNEHEQTLLAQFDGNFEQLDPAEQFLVNLVHIPNYAQKVDHMLLHEEFLTTVNWIGPAMDKLLVTAKGKRL
ncbi:hypothetical protein P879_00258 [Paragonimus westermani]|uniref:FH2 domain-containing protein n=1 Tax=Paragonimus westermani TaxID=34504 RepID=A0A8T0DRN7_9TREM|nr:hypothetical protein P879_00258 [Paragonimus westermani]